MGAPGLDRHRLALMAAKEDVSNPRATTNWAVFAYEKQHELKLLDSGAGGPGELAARLAAGSVMYGLCRLADPRSSAPRVLLVHWVGEKVPESQRQACAGHLPAIRAFFREASAVLSVRRPEEVTLEGLQRALAQLAPAAPPTRRDPVPDAQELVGTNYCKTNPALEIRRTQRDSFWAQAEREEEERREAERRRAQQERQRWERQRMEEERRTAAERERRCRQHERDVQAQREERARRDAEERARERARWEQQQREQEEAEQERSPRSDSSDKAAEAAALVSQRAQNPRDFFRQRERSGSLSGAPLPASPAGAAAGARRPFLRYQRSLTEAAYIFRRPEPPPGGPPGPGPTAPRAAPTPSPRRPQPRPPLGTGPPPPCATAGPPSSAPPSSPMGTGSPLPGAAVGPPCSLSGAGAPHSASPTGVGSPLPGAAVGSPCNPSGAGVPTPSHPTGMGSYLQGAAMGFPCSSQQGPPTPTSPTGPPPPCATPRPPSPAGSGPSPSAGSPPGPGSPGSTCGAESPHPYSGSGEGALPPSSPSKTASPSLGAALSPPASPPGAPCAGDGSPRRPGSPTDPPVQGAEGRPGGLGEEPPLLQAPPGSPGPPGGDGDRDMEPGRGRTGHSGASAQEHRGWDPAEEDQPGDPVLLPQPLLKDTPGFALLLSRNTGHTQLPGGSGAAEDEAVSPHAV